MDKKTDRFYQFMVSYAEFMSEMSEQENRKYKALISNDLKQMDKTIAEQQAMLMKLEKMEGQRLDLQRETGWEGLKFREILDRLKGEDQRSFRKLFEQISRLLEQIQTGNEKSISFAKMSLQVSSLLNTDENPEIQQNYTAQKGKPAEEEDAAGSVFETTI